MQQKKADYNSIIGILLMGLLLVAYFYYMQSTVVQNEDSAAKLKTEENKTGTFDKVQANEQPTIGSFIDKQGGVSEPIVLENDKIRLGINIKGGEPYFVQLKGFHAYDQKKDAHDTKDLYLIQQNSSAFNLRLLGQEVINTKDLVFTPELIKQDKGSVLKLTASSQKGSQIQYTYYLPKTGYLLDFDITSQNLEKENKPEKALLSWDYKVYPLEKGRTWEDNYTELYYSLDQYKTIDYLSATANLDEKKEPNLNWVAYKQQFFSSILSAKVPLDSVRLKSIKHEETAPYLKTFSMDTDLKLINNNINASFSWYFGPNDYDLMKGYGKNFELVIPFGWGIFGWLNHTFFLTIIQWLEKTGLGYGFIILLMTLVVKIILFPIMFKQHKQSAMMRVLKPELEEINKKHKDADPLKRQQITMEVYRKAGVNPMAGCIPALLQIPIFIALFRFFPNVINLREKSFLWAEDLTSYDSIYQLPFYIPFYGDHVSLFTMLYCIAMIIYTRMTANNISQPTQEGMPDMRFIMYLMPILMLFWFNSYASGLSWYYLASNIINILMILVIKYFMIDEKQIQAKIQENKQKLPKKVSKWQARLQEAMKKAQEQQQKRQKNS